MPAKWFVHRFREAESPAPPDKQDENEEDFTRQAVARQHKQAIEDEGPRSIRGYGDYSISSPIGTWPGTRNVFTSSPSPQTIMPENLLNHFPCGTCGCVSNQSTIKVSC